MTVVNECLENQNKKPLQINLPPCMTPQIKNTAGRVVMQRWQKLKTAESDSVTLVLQKWKYRV